MNAEIYLVRHGETEWNAQGRFQGCLDSPLTPNGREQARQFGVLLARVLNGYRGVTMHVSSLGRACETAEIVRKYVPVAAPIREPRIREGTGLRMKISTRAGPACCTAPIASTGIFGRRTERPMIRL